MVLFWGAALGNEYNAQILLSLLLKADTKKNIVCAMRPLLFFFVKHKFLFLQRLKINEVLFLGLHSHSE